MMSFIIKNKADYAEVERKRDEATKQAVEHAKAGVWTKEGVIDAIVAATLPYFLALNDISNPVAHEISQKQAIAKLSSQYGTTFEELSKTQYPNLQSVISSGVQKLNKLHGVNFPPLKILVGDLRNQTPAGYMLNGDFILIDKSLLSSKGDSDKDLFATVSHELGHRYQRSEEKIQSILKATFAEAMRVPLLDNKTLAHMREVEATADFEGARLTSPNQMKTMLLNAAKAEIVFGEFIFQVLNGNGISVPNMKTAFSVYGQLKEADKSKIDKAFAGLNARDLEDLSKKAFSKDNAGESSEFHPSFQHRIMLQDTLIANPKLLECKNIKFDGSANIVSAQECGPGKTTMKVPPKKAEAERK